MFFNHDTACLTDVYETFEKQVTNEGLILKILPLSITALATNIQLLKVK